VAERRVHPERASRTLCRAEGVLDLGNLSRGVEETISEWRRIMPQYSEHPTQKCGAKSFGNGPCGNPVFMKDGEVFHRDQCLDCILISTFVGARIQTLEARFPSNFTVMTLMPEVVQRFKTNVDVTQGLSRMGL
jgi:hypothetical protein